MSGNAYLPAGAAKLDAAAFLEQNCRHVEQDHSFLVDFWLHRRWTHKEKFSAREVVSVGYPDWSAMLAGVLADLACMITFAATAQYTPLATLSLCAPTTCSGQPYSCATLPVRATQCGRGQP